MKYGPELNVVAMLHNQKQNTWHPICFRPSPLPGGSEIPRFKSWGHHTAGFKTRQEAVDSIQAELAPKLPGLAVDVERDIEWDGADIPAMTVFVIEGKVRLT